LQALLELLRRGSGWATGIIAFSAWLALLYFMFWDVL